MKTKANTWSGYRLRVGLIGLVCLGFGGCSIWDASVRYPGENKIKAAYDNISEETRDLDWPDLAKQEGFPKDPDKVPRHFKTDWDIKVQYVMAAITLPIGLVFAFSFLRSYGRWVASDEEGVTTSWGHNVRFDQVARLDKKRWSKGIAVVHHSDGNEPRKLVLDGWKFDREPIDAIVEEVESRLSPDQIDQPAGAAAPASNEPDAADEPADTESD